MSRLINRDPRYLGKRTTRCTCAVNHRCLSLIVQGDITTVHSLPVSHRAISHSSSVITISSNVITLQVHMYAAPAIMVPTVGIAMHVQPAHSNQFHHRAVTSTSASHAPWVSTVPPLHLRLQQAPASPLDTTAL